MAALTMFCERCEVAIEFVAERPFLAAQTRVARVGRGIVERGQEAEGGRPLWRLREAEGRTPVKACPHRGGGPLMADELTFGYFADAWLDEDGEHVWIAHSCKGEGVIHQAPNIWRASADGTHVEPSYSCDRCGLHQTVEITTPPRGWDGNPRYAEAS